MEAEQFSLSWNNFHNNLTSGFQSLLNGEEFVDVIIAAEGKFLKAHKTILSVCSPFFKELFLVNPSKDPIIILPDVDYTSLGNVLQFIYPGEVSVDQEDLPNFMRVAELLKVKGLTENPTSNTETNGCIHSNAKRTGSPQNDKVLNKRTRPLRKGLKTSTNTVSTCTKAAVQEKSLSPSLLTLKDKFCDVGKQEEIQDFKEVVPKKEIKDLHETSQSDREENLDFNLINSPVDSSPSLRHDSSSPGTLRIIMGKRGNPRLIIDGHSFFKKSVYKGKVFWYCKQNRLPEKCMAVCWTQFGNIVKWPDPAQHMHPIIPDSFHPEEDSEIPIENLQDILIESALN